MVQRFLPFLGGLDKNGQIFLCLLLPDVLPQGLGPQGTFLDVLLKKGFGHDWLFIDIVSKINAQMRSPLFPGNVIAECFL